MTPRRGAASLPALPPYLPALLGPRWVLCLLGVASTWLLLSIGAGRFNDGGWYLLAARQVLEGGILYRDVTLPHPPLAVLVYLPAVALGSGVGIVVVGRLLAAGLSLLGILLAVAALPTGSARRRGLLALVLLAALDPFTVYFLSQVKAYPSAALSLGATLLALARGAPGIAGLALGLGCGARLSLLAALPALLVAVGRRGPRALSGFFCGAGLVYLPAALLAGAAATDQFYVPMVGMTRVNAMTDGYLLREVAPGLGSWSARVLGSLARTLWTHPIALFLAFRGLARAARSEGADQAAALRFAGLATVLVGGAHLLARRPYADYQLILAPLVVFLAARGLDRRAAPLLARPAVLAWVVLTASLPGLHRGLRRFETSPRPALAELSAAAAATRAMTEPGEVVLSLDPYLVVASQRASVPGLELGRFGLRRPGERDRAGSVPLAELCRALATGGPAAAWLPADEADPLDPVTELTAAARAGGYRPAAHVPGFGERNQDLILWRAP